MPLSDEIRVGGDYCTCGGRLQQSEVPPAWHGCHLKGFFRCPRCNELCPRIVLTDADQGGLSPEVVAAKLKRQEAALLAALEGTS